MAAQMVMVNRAPEAAKVSGADLFSLSTQITGHYRSTNGR